MADAIKRQGRRNFLRAAALAPLAAAGCSALRGGRKVETGAGDQKSADAPPAGQTAAEPPAKGPSAPSSGEALKTLRALEVPMEVEPAFSFLAVVRSR